MLTAKEIIQELANDGSEIYGKVCKVTAVNGMTCDCEPIDGDAEIFDVRLIADDSNEFFVLVPAVGSFVVVEFITKEAAYISMVSKVKEVKWKIGDASFSSNDSEFLLKIANATFKINDQGFLIKKGDDTLKEVIQLIIEAVQAIVVIYGNNPLYDKLTQALTKLNNIMQ